MGIEINPRAAAIAELVLDLGIGNNHVHRVIGKRDRLHFLGPTIDQYEVIFFCKHRGKLIHDSTRDTGESLFSPLAK